MGAIEDVTKSMPRVLVVDDDPGIQLLVTRLLLRDGWSVDTADDGITALAKIRATQPDVVVLDVMLPQMSGLALLENLHREQPLRNVVIVTAASTRTLQSLECGQDVWEIVRKPFDIADLVASVRSCAFAHSVSKQ